MMNEHLQLALLAMDAYNRTADPSLAGVDGEIGDAMVSTAHSGAGGFSAQTYTLGDGIVISYCGTDQLVDLNSWWLATGDYGVAQAVQAASIYQTVLQGAVANNNPANIQLTGHSLGERGRAGHCFWWKW